MKYGNIIYDPTSDEARNLIGKKVIGGSSYTELHGNPHSYTEGTLREINECYPLPFELQIGYSKNCVIYMREIIEEKHTYRPYNNTKEMIEDYYERFEDKIVKSPLEMPLIWIKKKDREFRELINYFDEEKVDGYSFRFLFNTYTFLDGSPCGKEITE